MNSLGTLVENQLIIYVWIYFWNLLFILLVCMLIHTVFMTVVLYCFESGEHESPTFLFLYIVLTIWELFQFHMNLRIGFSISTKIKKCIRISVWIALNLSIPLGSIATLTILSFLIHEQSMSLHLFRFAK